MGALRRQDPWVMDRQTVGAMLVEESESVDVSLRCPTTTTLRTQYPRHHLLQLHLRISPKLRALEIPP